MRRLDGISNSMDMNLSKLQEVNRQGGLGCFSPWGRKESTGLSDSTGLNCVKDSGRSVFVTVAGPQMLS